MRIAQMKDITNIVLNMVKVNMGAKQKDKILVLSDDFNKKRTELAKEVYNLLSKKYLNANFLLYENTGQNGKEPSRQIASKFLDYDIIIMLNSFSLSHTKARRKATARGARIASMPGFNRDMFFTGMAADYTKIKKDGEKLKQLIEKEKEAKIISINGTELYLKLNKIVEGDFGIFDKKGDWGNLPSGEVCLWPKFTSGKLVINSGCFYDKSSCVPNKKPIVFYIENSEIKDIQGDKLSNNLKDLFFKYEHRKKVAELGIGLNNKARSYKDVLEAEKIKGTIHIAFGNNIALGGKNNSDAHYDFVLSNPTLFIGKEEIIRNGKYLF
jgi:leucyl aminopeptidase (aminopeptidase T)